MKKKIKKITVKHNQRKSIKEVDHLFGDDERAGKSHGQHIQGQVQTSLTSHEKLWK